MARSIPKTYLLLLIVGFTLLPIGPRAFAFFSDAVPVSGSVFATGTLSFDFTVEKDWSEEVLSLGETDTKEIKVKNTGSLDLNYDGYVKITEDKEGLCNQLSLKYTNSGNYVPLKDFAFSLSNIVSGGEDHLNLTIKRDSDGMAFDSAVCKFEFKFDAWQTSLNKNDGFTDQGTVSNEIHNSTETIEEEPEEKPEEFSDEEPSDLEEPETDNLTSDEGDQITLGHSSETKDYEIDDEEEDFGETDNASVDLDGNNFGEINDTELEAILPDEEENGSKKKPKNESDQEAEEEENESSSLAGESDNDPNSDDDEPIEEPNDPEGEESIENLSDSEAGSAEDLDALTDEELGDSSEPSEDDQDASDGGGTSERDNSSQGDNALQEDPQGSGELDTEPNFPGGEAGSEDDSAIENREGLSEETNSSLDDQLNASVEDSSDDFNNGLGRSSDTNNSGQTEGALPEESNKSDQNEQED